MSEPKNVTRTYRDYSRPVEGESMHESDRLILRAQRLTDRGLARFLAAYVRQVENGDFTNYERMVVFTREAEWRLACRDAEVMDR